MPMHSPAPAEIHLEEAEVLAREDLAAGQHLLRLRAPRLAAGARPGSFAHLRCDPRLAMRRPLSVMRAWPDSGEVEFLFKVVGEGTRALAGREPGERLSVLGPIGVPFTPVPGRGRALLVGGGVGIPPLIFLAERLRAAGERSVLALFGSEVPFPFRPRPSEHLVAGMPEGVIAAAPLLEDWGVASRLASLQGFPGCHQGLVTDLARRWLEAIEPAARAEVALYACGPWPMLAACAALAAELDLPCQVALEEHMACAVGGCAGCAVRVRAGRGEAMRRVCVDGPVFDAAEVVW